MKRDALRPAVPGGSGGSPDLAPGDGATVALIGLGLMGSALAERLLAAGHGVRGFDVDAGRLEAFAGRGGTPAASAADAAAGAPIVVTCLMTAAIVREAVFGAGGAAHAMPVGSILVDTTTCAPAESVALARDLAGRGIAVVDATLSGSSAAARAGEVVVLAGGDADAFERCRPIFDAFARKVFHLGPNGSGAAAKLVSNLVLGLNRLALAEGLTLGLAAGLEPAALLQTLKESAAYSRAMDAKGQRMITGEFAADARLSQHLKDVGLILGLAGDLGVSLPATSLHRRILERAVELGWGDADNSAVIMALGDRGIMNGDGESAGLASPEG